MKKRVVLSMLAGMLLLQSIPVSAQEMSQTSSISSSFSLDKPTDLSKIIVTLPARMDLSLNEAETQYTNQSQVSAKGDLHEDYRLEVSTPSTVTYKSTGNPDVTGAVTFGTQTWTSAQLEASKTVLDSRDISVAVNNSNLKYVTYDGVLDFDIKVVDDGSTGGSGTEDLSEAIAYTLTNNDIALCTIDGDTLTIPRSFERDRVLYKVTALGDNAFYNPATYKSIIPNTVRKVVIPDTVTSIGDCAFEFCTSLTTINIPDSVTSIGEGTFEYCTSLTTINIPDSVTSIENIAFKYCTSLTTINIPDGVTSIGDCAFEYCSSLTTINIPDSVTSIENYTFYNCDSLTTINIPDSVTSIGESAFYNCDSLTTINIPDSVTSIGDSVFSACDNLTKINIPDSVTSIGDSVFSGCDNLTTINIPDSVTSIGYNAFSDCSSLTSITIPDSVTSIEKYAFNYCTSLTTINIPDSVTSIGNSAFNNCNSLTTVNYSGTKAQFQQISGYTNISGKTIHCTDGDLSL